MLQSNPVLVPPQLIAPFLSSIQRTIEDIRTAKKLQKESCERKVVKGKLLAKCFKTKLAFQKLQVKSYFPKVDDNKNGPLEDY